MMDKVEAILHSDMPVSQDYVRRQQRWLLFLRHSAKCTSINCQYGQSCLTAKALWQHMLECANPQCPYPRSEFWTNLFSSAYQRSFQVRAGFTCWRRQLHRGNGFTKSSTRHLLIFAALVVVVDVMQLCRCVNSRDTLRHYQRCSAQSNNCPICTPVNQYIHQQRLNRQSQSQVCF